MAFIDSMNDRYADRNTIYERQLIFWMWLWLPLFAVRHLWPQARAKYKANQEKKKKGHL